jgi:hypothetical protein
VRLFGGQFLGQAVTFVYLTQTGQTGPGFNATLWPQFSLYNFLIANFWPIYWIGFAIDRAKLKTTYWHIFAVAHERAGDVLHLVKMLIG